MLLVETADGVAHLRTEHALERAPVGGDHVHLDVSRAERRGDLEPDEARAQDDHPAGSLRRLDDRAAVGQRAQVVNGRARLAGQREPNRIGPGGQNDRVEFPPGAVIEGEALAAGIERGHLTAAYELDPALLVIAARLQRKLRTRREM